MTLLHQLISQQVKKAPSSSALIYKNKTISYLQLDTKIKLISQQFSLLGIKSYQRIGIYLPKTIETVCSFFASTTIGAIFVPINPVLKTPQVQFILNDCNVRLLVTSYQRYKSLGSTLSTGGGDLKFIILIDKPNTALVDEINGISILYLEDLLQEQEQTQIIATPLTNNSTIIDSNTATLFYTSGSTGNPKAVMLSHRNLILGAQSVSSYLNNTHKDKILAVLPLSFDYGFNQLTSAFFVGACVVLMDYLLPRDILKAVDKYQITGLAGVPSLWSQLAPLKWNKSCSLRYFTNSGGSLPLIILARLRQSLVNANPYLMYGLTEAFRSTYVPPKTIDKHLNSIGIAIPNAQVMVLRDDGSECADNEAGELVHFGELVAQGYWNRAAQQAKRFRPRYQENTNNLQEKVLWSGDKVYRDKDGYLYFISRKDDMIKTSGYRVSPNEIEQIVNQLPLIKESIALGVKHPALGQAIILLIMINDSPESVAKNNDIIEQVSSYCKINLPNYMQAKNIIIKSNLPLNQNGKIDRKHLSNEYKNMFL